MFEVRAFVGTRHGTQTAKTRFGRTSEPERLQKRFCFFKAIFMRSVCVAFEWWQRFSLHGRDAIRYLSLAYAYGSKQVCTHIGSTATRCFCRSHPTMELEPQKWYTSRQRWKCWTSSCKNACPPLRYWAGSRLTISVSLEKDSQTIRTRVS